MYRSNSIYYSDYANILMHSQAHEGSEIADIVLNNLIEM